MATNETNRKIDNNELNIEIEMIKPKAHIGLFGAVAFGIGIMFGSGIFISPSVLLMFSGSKGASLIIWALCGLMTLLTGLVYAELATIFPQSGGEFIYIKYGLREFPAFLVVWIIPLFSSTASITVTVLGFTEYLTVWLSDGCSLPNYVNNLISALMVFTIGSMNAYSASFSKRVQIVCTIAKMLVVIVICFSGIIVQFQGTSVLPSDSFAGTHNDAISYSLALYSCMFAYNGFTRIGDIAEEIINPRSNIPKAIFISVSTATVLYVLINVSYFSVLTKNEMLHSNAVVYDWSVRKIPFAVPFIQICILLSFYGSMNGTIFSTSRVMFAAARAGYYPEVLSFLNIKSSVPVLSILVVQCICYVWLLVGGVVTLINFLQFMITIARLLSTLSLIKIRYDRRKNNTEIHEAFHTHIAIPLLNAIICGFMIIVPFISAPRSEFLYGLGVIVCGVFVYILFIRLRQQFPGTDRLTIFCQLLFDLSPTVKVE